MAVCVMADGADEWVAAYRVASVRTAITSAPAASRLGAAVRHRDRLPVAPSWSAAARFRSTAASLAMGYAVATPTITDTVQWYIVCVLAMHQLMSLWIPIR